MDRSWLRQRRLRARQKARFTARLGGRCSRCGATERLEFDHVDPTTKRFDIVKRLGCMSEAVLATEVAKCQLLCRKHHAEKTRTEHAQRAQSRPIAHGKIATYYKYKCRCDACRKARSDYYYAGVNGTRTKRT